MKQLGSLIVLMVLVAVAPLNSNAQFQIVGKLDDAISPQLDSDRCSYWLTINNPFSGTETYSVTLPAGSVNTFQTKTGTLVEQVIVPVTPEIFTHLYDSGYVEFTDKNYHVIYLDYLASQAVVHDALRGKIISNTGSQEQVNFPPLSIIADIIAKPTLVGKTAAPEAPVKGVYFTNKSSTAVGFARIVTPEFFTINKSCSVTDSRQPREDVKKPVTTTRG